ncbi:hypothetical protein ACWNYH_00765 [Candidatus Vidania fulgoroideorum]
MSKKGSKRIPFKNVFFTYSKGIFSSKGYLGTRRLVIKGVFFIFVSRYRSLLIRPVSILNNVLWGTYYSHISNCIYGVSVGFTKTIVSDGVGYFFEIKKNNLIVSAGFSSLSVFFIPNFIFCIVNSSKCEVIIKCIDNIKLGDFCSSITKIRKYNSYKRCGIRMIDDDIILKPRNKK